MAFFDKDLGRETSVTSSLDNLIKLTADKPVTIQILEPKLTQRNIIWRHYIPAALRKSGQRGIPVKCPGISVCPVCIRNKELGGDKTHDDYIAPQKRISVNVLDLTPVRQCPVCETNNGTRDHECSNCGHRFSQDDPVTTPTDRVRLLERGVTLFTQLDMLENSVTAPYNPDDPKNNPEIDYTGMQPGDHVPVGIMRFPVTLSLSGSGGKTVITPIPGQVNDIDWREYQDKLLDPQSAYFDITPEEVAILVAGGSLSEVLKSRKVEPELTDFSF